MTDTSSDGPAKNGPSKKWLYASVALNLLLAGIVAGGVVGGRNHHGPGGRPPPPMAVRDIGYAFMRALPEERRAELFKKSGDKLRDARPLFEESMKLRKEAFAMIEQDTIDPAALKAAYAKVREADAAAQSRAGDAFADMVATLPVAERRAAVAKVRERWAAREAQRIERWTGRDEKGRDGPGPDGPPPEGAPPSDAPPQH